MEYMEAFWKKEDSLFTFATNIAIKCDTYQQILHWIHGALDAIGSQWITMLIDCNII